MITNTYRLIILPGWGGSQHTWAPFVNHIQSAFADIQVIDLPCFGNEPCPKEVWGVAEYAHFVEQKIRALPAAPTVLLGHSFGGQVATYLVATNPGICDTLILSGAAVYRPKKWIKRAIFWSIAKVGRSLVRLPIIKNHAALAKKLLYAAADSPDYRHTNSIQRAIFQKVIREDVSHMLASIACNTLIVWGEKDRYTPLRYAKKLHQSIPHSTYRVIKEGTHGLHLHQQETLAQTIIDFLSSSKR